MIYFKEGVLVGGVQPHTFMAISIVGELYSRQGKHLTITSLTDPSPKRKPNTKHKLGDAFDARISNLTLPQLQQVALESRKKLVGWDVVVEKDHLHVEWDPHDPSIRVS